MTPDDPHGRLRILTLCYEFPPLGGGGSKVAHGLAARLAEAGHDVDLVTTRYQGYAAQESVDGIAVERVRAWRRRADRSNAFELATYVLPCLWRAWQLCRSKQPDVVHAHFIFPDGIACWLLRLFTGRRYVITAHGSDVPGYNPDRFQLAHILLRPLWHRVVKGADAIVCPSPWLKDLLRRESPQAKLVVIPNGFDPSRFAAATRKPAPAGGLAEAGAPFVTEAAGRWRSDEILCVSRLMERKGLQHLLRAMALLEDRPTVHIVGVGPYEPELRQIAAELALDVVFHGWIDNAAPELAALFARAGIFVLPSSTENFPVSLLEAMSAGLAIVTTADTGCEDVVGEAAMLVPYGDPEALAEALRRLVERPAERQALGALGRQRLLDNFAWPVVAAKYAAAYRRHPAVPGARLEPDRARDPMAARAEDASSAMSMAGEQYMDRR